MVPVGLFGLQTKMSCVRGVIAPAIARRSKRRSGVSGVLTSRARITAVLMSYTGNDEQQVSTSSPSSRYDTHSSRITPSAPLPTRIISASTPWCAASAWRSRYAWASGYIFSLGSASRSACRTTGDAPIGFSFDASLMMSVSPYSRCTSSMGLPGT